MSIKICSNDNGGVSRWSEIQTVRGVFKNFKSLPKNCPGFMLDSQVTVAHGLPWSIWVYPCGYDGDESGNIGVYLHCPSDRGVAEGIATHLKYRIRTEIKSLSRTASIDTCIDGTASGHHRFLPRDDAMIESMLVKGALVVHADIQIPAAATPPAWVPKSECTSLRKGMLRLLKGASEMGDVKFVVDGQDFFAHRHILRVRSAALYELVDAVGGDSRPSAIPISNVGKDEFTVLLRYVYANETPKWSTNESDGPCPRAVLEIADKFGCTGLKLVAEAELADNHIAAETAADLILLADCKHCALLKESAVLYFADNVDAVMSSDGWKRLSESSAILTEMIQVGFGGGKPLHDNIADGGYRRMYVSTLWAELEKRGLDLDGSKEILANRLEQSDAEVNHIFGVAGGDDEEDDAGDEE
mmetsp:Transcript_36727/g.74830  ORF Transcript_36727/g.74830 Transcript_36727/m.74830 type:complete len:415 (-) Transcript_36727:228-1472(-)